MALIGYARVSTTDQDLEVQIQALEKKGCLKIFQDKKSGTTDNRPGFLACFEYLREGDVLYMTHLDRFARNKLITESRFEELRNRGIDVQAIDHTIDIHTPEGNLMVGIGSSVAQYQRDRISQCTLGGLAKAAAMGRFGGRPPALDDSQVKQVGILHSQLNREYTVADLCKTFKVSMSVITRAVRKARAMGWYPEQPQTS